MSDLSNVGGDPKCSNLNVLDRFISFISPRHGLERQKLRSAANYIGAATTRRQTSGWRTPNLSADKATLPELPTLRKRSSSLVCNNPLAAAVINKLTTAVVGTGFKFQSKLNGEFLGLSPEDVEIKQRDIEREWRLFSDTSDCDVSRRLNFNQIIKLAFRSMLERGDSFINSTFQNRHGSIYSQRLQVIEADLVSNPDNKQDTDLLKAGVEFGNKGEVLAYHISNKHPGSGSYFKDQKWQKIRAYGGLTGRKSIIHLFNALRPGQTRGVPFLASIIEPLRMLDEYYNSTLLQAAIESFFTAFVTTKAGEPDPLNMSLPLGGVDDSREVEETAYKMGPGAIISLAEGQDVKFGTSNSPGGNFSPFVLSQEVRIGAATEIPLEVLRGYFQSSYSAAKGALNEFWRTVTVKRNDLIKSSCSPILMNFMIEAVSRGRIIAPGFLESEEIRRAYTQGFWIGDRRGYLDEKQAVQAAKDRIDARLSTRTIESQELIGDDWDDINSQLLREENKIPKLETEEQQE